MDNAIIVHLFFYHPYNSFIFYELIGHYMSFFLPDVLKINS